MKKIILLLFLLIISSITLIAEEGSIKIEADKNLLSENESLNFSIIFENIKGGNYSIEGIDNFKIVSRSQSQSTTIINMKTTSKQTIDMVLMPKGQGKSKIQVSMNAGGKTVKSNIIELEVKKGITKEGKRNTGEQGFFLETNLSKKKIFEGEKSVYSVDLFTKYNINGAGFVDAVKFDNFISKEVDRNSLKKGYEMVENEQYLKYEAMKSILLPVKAGKYTIPPFKFQVNIVVDDGFFGSVSPNYVTTAEKEVEVKSLPEKPVDFSGIIGKPEMALEISTKKINFGDAVTLKVKLYGECTLDSVSALMKNGSSNIKVYESEKGFVEEIRGGRYYAEKNYEIALIPEITGDVKFLGQKIVYFDTEKEEYRTIEIAPFTINVSGGTVNNSTKTTNKSIVIDRIEQEADKDYFTFKIKKKNVYIALAAFGVILLIGVIVLGVMARKEKKSIASIYLKELKKLNNENEIYNFAVKAVKEKTGVNIKVLNFEEIKEHFSEESAELIIKLNNYVENKKYQAIDKFDIKNTVSEIIKKIY